jgi:hypothetical protein
MQSRWDDLPKADEEAKICPKQVDISARFQIPFEESGAFTLLDRR